MTVCGQVHVMGVDKKMRPILPVLVLAVLAVQALAVPSALASSPGLGTQLVTDATTMHFDLATYQRLEAGLAQSALETGAQMAGIPLTSDTTALEPTIGGSAYQGFSYINPTGPEFAPALGGEVASAGELVAGAGAVTSAAAAMADSSAGGAILLRSAAGWVPYVGGALAVGWAAYSAYHQFFPTNATQHNPLDLTDRPLWSFVPGDGTANDYGSVVLSGGNCSDSTFYSDARGDLDIDWSGPSVNTFGAFQASSLPSSVEIHSLSFAISGTLASYVDYDAGDVNKTHMHLDIIAPALTLSGFLSGTNTATVHDTGTVQNLVYPLPSTGLTIMKGSASTNFNHPLLWDVYGVQQVSYVLPAPLKTWPQRVGDALGAGGTPFNPVGAPDGNVLKDALAPWAPATAGAPPMHAVPSGTTVPIGVPVWAEQPNGTFKKYQSITDIPTEDPGMVPPGDAVLPQYPTTEKGLVTAPYPPFLPDGGVDPTSGPTTAPTATPTVAPSGAPTTSPSAGPSPLPAPFKDPLPPATSGENFLTHSVTLLKTCIPGDFIADAATAIGATDTHLHWVSFAGQSLAEPDGHGGTTAVSVEQDYDLDWLKPILRAMEGVCVIGLIAAIWFYV